MDSAAHGLDRLTPESILEVEFREKLRGYNPEDVDRYLEQVAAAVRDLQAQLDAALQRAASAEADAAAAADPGTAAARTLVLAQRTADAAVTEAREEAARIIGDALRDVEQHRADAEREAVAEIHRLHAMREQLQGEVAALQSWLSEEREKLRATLASTLSQLDAAAPALSPPPAVRPITLPAQPDFGAEIAAPPEEPADAVQPGDVAATAEEEPSHVDSADDDVVDPPGDAFIAELRRAVIDDRPLGPREDMDDISASNGEHDPFEEFIRYAGDSEEPRGLTSRLRRRR